MLDLRRKREVPLKKSTLALSYTARGVAAKFYFQSIVKDMKKVSHLKKTTSGLSHIACGDTAKFYFQSIWL